MLGVEGLRGWLSLLFSQFWGLLIGCDMSLQRHAAIQYNKQTHNQQTP
jgi:hypothetical protein